jgi:hypothetical protein
MAYRNRRLPNNINRVDVSSIIESNRGTKAEYNELLDSIVIELRKYVNPVLSAGR